MQFFDYRGVVAIWHESKCPGCRVYPPRPARICSPEYARFGLGRQMPQAGKRQVAQLLSGWCENRKVALIALVIRGHVQFGAPCAPVFALDVMPGGHAICVQVLGRLQQVFEFHPLIAANAGHRAWRPAR